MAYTSFTQHLKDKYMTNTITGKSLPPVDIAVSLPTQRQDGTPLPLAEIQSVTILRSAGGGEATVLKVLPGPFSSETVMYTDVSASGGTDIYSFYATDTQGVEGEKSLAKAVIVTGELKKVAPAAGTLAAHAHIGDKPIVLDPAPQAAQKPAPFVPPPSNDVDDNKPGKSARR
jgi:hypothetical protein